MSQPAPPPRPPHPSDSHFYGEAPSIKSPINEGTPPPPPPKTAAHYSGQNTPHNGPPLPPPPPRSSALHVREVAYRQDTGTRVPVVENGWLPDALRDKSKADLDSLMKNPTLLNALLYAPDTRHAAIPESNAQLEHLLSQNISLAQHLNGLANNLTHQRAAITTKLLSLRALERQWHMKQATMDDALSPFAPKAVHTRLVTGIQEQGAVLQAMEESFLEDDGKAGEREIAEFLRRWKEGKKILVLREERRQRFEEGRVGGWK
jgi:hypothetical protein